jgi:hypothetical protein
MDPLDRNLLQRLLKQTRTKKFTALESKALYEGIYSAYFFSERDPKTEIRRSIDASLTKGRREDASTDLLGMLLWRSVDTSDVMTRSHQLCFLYKLLTAIDWSPRDASRHIVRFAQTLQIPSIVVRQGGGHLGTCGYDTDCGAVTIEVPRS